MDNLLPQSQPRQRPTNLADMGAVLDQVFTAESLANGLAFQPRPTDIIISPYPKSGTTWLQQIVHGLRTGGSMDFDEITAVTPWLEVAQSFDWDLDAEQVANPRAYKSHLNWYEIPKGGRYIVSIRNPRDAMVSFYRFFEGLMFEPGSISIDDLTRSFFPRDPESTDSYWHHLVSWWSVRDEPNVLLLSYEAMKADHPATVRRVAQFMDIAPDNPAVDIATRQSTREFMLAHQEHFDEKYMRRRTIQVGELPPGGDLLKVTAGAGDEAKYRLSAGVLAEMDDLWRQIVEPQTGFANYEALRAALALLS